MLHKKNVNKIIVSVIFSLASCAEAYSSCSYDSRKIQSVEHNEYTIRVVEKHNSIIELSSENYPEKTKIFTPQEYGGIVGVGFLRTGEFAIEGDKNSYIIKHTKETTKVVSVDSIIDKLKLCRFKIIFGSCVSSISFSESLNSFLATYKKSRSESGVIIIGYSNYPIIMKTPNQIFYLGEGKNKNAIFRSHKEMFSMDKNLSVNLCGQ